MAKKKTYFIPKKMSTTAQIKLALGFIGEHKKEFEEWLKTKGCSLSEDVEEGEVDYE